MVDYSPCAVQRYTASMVRWQACERRDHGRCANPGGEVRLDQEVSIVDLKNSLMGELRGDEGLTVMPEESPVGASAANAMI